MLIYLNTAIESWQTVNSQFPDASSLGFDDVPIVDRNLAPAQEDHSEEGNRGHDNLPSYSYRWVHRHRNLGVQPQAQSAL